MKIQKTYARTIKVEVEEKINGIIDHCEVEAQDNIKSCMNAFMHTVTEGMRMTVAYDEIEDYSDMIRKFLRKGNSILVFSAPKAFPVKYVQTLNMFKCNSCEYIVFFDGSLKNEVTMDIVPIKPDYKPEIYDVDFTIKYILKQK